MKLRHQLFAIALLMITSVSGMAGVSAEEKRERLRTLRAEAFRKVNVRPLDRAYLDAFTVLDQQNTCSEFFGGHTAQGVLEALVIELRESRIPDSRIGIRMSGPFVLFVDSEKIISYRLFPDAELNTQGPFCKSKVFASEPFVPNVGSFQPNTREVRVLILLHELAHLIQGRNGTWLIPDDGSNPQLSRQNTSTVESVCGKEIRAL
jgi:hypothetical protein